MSAIQQNSTLPGGDGVLSLLPQLNSINTEYLQKILIDNADMSQLDKDVMSELNRRQLDVNELLGIAFVANEGLLLFKPTNSKNYEVLFTHSDEMNDTTSNDTMCYPPKKKSNLCRSSDIDIQKLVQELELGQEWMDFAQEHDARDEHTTSKNADTVVGSPCISPNSPTISKVE